MCAAIFSGLMIGAGGLGAPLGMYLAAAGVGRIGIVDFDVVDFTNLQRKVIHGTGDVGRKKLDSAADTMHEINPYVQIDKHETALSSENALALPTSARRKLPEPIRHVVLRAGRREWPGVPGSTWPGMSNSGTTRIPRSRANSTISRTSS